MLVVSVVHWVQVSLMCSDPQNPQWRPWVKWRPFRSKPRVLSPSSKTWTTAVTMKRRTRKREWRCSCWRKHLVCITLISSQSRSWRHCLVYSSSFLVPFWPHRPRASSACLPSKGWMQCGAASGVTVCSTCTASSSGWWTVLRSSLSSLLISSPTWSSSGPVPSVGTSIRARSALKNTCASVGKWWDMLSPFMCVCI